MKKIYFKHESAVLLCGDSLRLSQMVKPGTIDMIFADPPYFLSNGGVTCSSGRMVCVNKGEWDACDDKHAFNRQWIAECRKALKPTGTIWISGTLHNIYSVGRALEEEGFRIINNITWQKTNPPPNLACKCFTHSTETVLWARKIEGHGKYTFNYAAMKEMNGGKQMKDVWSGPLTKLSEKEFGKHPTQKPLYLLERIILASTKSGDLVLDPFCGTSTTGVACIRNGRKYTGVDNDDSYLEISKRRLSNEFEKKL